MKFSYFLLALLLFPSLLFAFPAKVVRVIDGDTIVALAANNEQVRVRLYGIDCPERKQPFGAMATRFVREHYAGKPVEVKPYGRKSWERIVGVVSDMNEKLLEVGLAWVYPQYCKKDFCRQWQAIEARAQADKRGLWQDKEPVPPWLWRRRREIAMATNDRYQPTREAANPEIVDP